MKTNSTCCGGAASTSTACDNAIAELPRYYPRQLITPDDLTLEQNYFRDRMRRHNRLLHGWGVVCGALVCPVTTTAADSTVTTTPWQVQVQEGYALGPYGDEIILDCQRTVDLRTQGCSGVTGEPCIDAPDPWCSQVFSTPAAQTTFCVAIKYKQSQMRPVRVQPVGCGCDDTTCEYSRLHDGYEIGILPACPANQQNPPSLDKLFQQAPEPACPDCPTQPWVALAMVNVDGGGNIISIDNCSCRRLILSFGNLWWQCSGTVTINVVTVTDKNSGNTLTSIPADGTTQAVVNVAGSNLYPSPVATYTLGDGITIYSVVDTSSAQQPHTSVALTVAAALGAAIGPRTLTIVNADCSVAVKTGAVTVQPPPKPASTATVQTAAKDVTPTTKASKKVTTDTAAKAAPAVTPAPAAATPAATPPPKTGK